MTSYPYIGLFGTCGGSKWRDTFIARYDEIGGIRYFNPQVDDWTPEMADIEAQHLKRDTIILFPVTSETYGTGSLAETGFSILQAVETHGDRWVVLMIDQHLDDVLMADPVAAKESLRARRLVAAHLKANPKPHVFVVETLEEMLELSLKLWDVGTLIHGINTTYRPLAA